MKLFNTPRRLAVYIKDVAEKQADIQEEAKGPAKKSLWMLTETGQKPLSDFQKAKAPEWMTCI